MRMVKSEMDQMKNCRDQHMPQLYEKAFPAAKPGQIDWDTPGYSMYMGWPYGARQLDIPAGIGI